MADTITQTVTVKSGKVYGCLPHGGYMQIRTDETGGHYYYGPYRYSVSGTRCEQVPPLVVRHKK